MPASYRDLNHHALVALAREGDTRAEKELNRRAKGAGQGGSRLLRKTHNYPFPFQQED